LKMTSFILFVLPLFFCSSTGAASSATHGSSGDTEVPSTISHYNLTYTAALSRQDAFEHMHLAAALSGLANRAGPLLYTTLTSADTEWKTYLSSSGQWLNSTTFLPLSNVTTLVETLASVYSGVVLYDPKVYATSNLASTASGVYNLLPVCYRPDDPSSLYSVLVGSGSRLQVVMNLVGIFNGSRTGSAKCDAYLWAKEK